MAFGGLIDLPLQKSSALVAPFLGLIAALPGCTRDAVPQGSQPLAPVSASIAPSEKPPATPVQNDGAKRLDCEWVREKDNCWQTMKREIRACLGPLPIEGTLARDDKSCTASNAQVLFRPEAPKEPSWALDIEVRVANKTCFRYRDTGPETGMRFPDAPRIHVLEGPTGAAISFRTGMPPTLVCPDGTTLSAVPEDLGLNECITERVWEGALPLGGGSFYPSVSPIWFLLDPRWGHVFECERPRD